MPDYTEREGGTVVQIGQATLYCGDCLDVMPTLEPVSAVITDIPYGTTRCSWDAIIPFADMWRALNPVVRRGVPIVLFGSEPFSSALRMSNIRRFKYDWVWDKPKGTGFLNAKKQPLRGHEMVSVFGEGQVAYYPQKTTGHERKRTFRGKHLQTDVYGNMAGDYHYDSTERYPRSVVTFSSDTQNSSFHPTQKPVDLMRYLVRTYSAPGDTVLDFTMGSGTTGIACAMEKRRFIGIERRQDYFDIACQRIRDADGPLFAGVAA
jgi:site-specific DNA-methyltransferase (adenine-specific)